MPTAGPYGITQFDAAGLIGNYQAMQENRIRMMVLQKQVAKEERDAQTQSGVKAALLRYSGGAKREGAPSAQQPSDPLAPLPAAAPAAQPNAGDREKLFGELMALDPQMAGTVIESFSKMDKAQLEKTGARHERVMQIAAGIMQLDPSQRKAALQQSAPELQQLGYTPEQLANFDPSDQNLRQIVVSGMDVERIAKFVQPDYMNVNGEVIDQTALSRGDKSPVRYRSEYIDTDQGLARRPGGGPAPRTLTDDDIRQLDRGGPTAGPSGDFP